MTNWTALGIWIGILFAVLIFGWLRARAEKKRQASARGRKARYEALMNRCSQE